MDTSHKPSEGMTNMLYWKPTQLVDQIWLANNAQACKWTLNPKLGVWVRVTASGEIQSLPVGGSDARWVYELVEGRDDFRRRDWS